MRTATIEVRSGVTGQVTLPNGRAIRSGQTAKLKWEDFEKISPEALRTSVRVTAISDAPAAKRSDVNLALNSTTVPAGFKLGQVVEGFGENDKFKLIKVADAVNVTDGMGLEWADPTAGTVTADRVGGSSSGVFAGVAVGAITAGRYGWIQIDGIADAPANVGTAGDPVALHPTTDGGVRAYTGDESAVLVVDATGGTFTLTYAGQTTSALAYNASAAAVQTALRALSNIADADVTVTGTNALTPGLTITFGGALADQNLTDLTANAGSLTGGAGTATLTVTSGYADRGAGTVIGVSLGADGIVLRGALRRRTRHFRRGQY